MISSHTLTKKRGNNYALDNRYNFVGAWALGFGFAGQSLGALVHILLVIALIVLAIQLISGRRPVV
jgi:hypothetical protein